MFRKYILPVIALAGILLAISIASRANKTLPPAAPVSAAPQPPYRSFVAGAGIIEANTENIAIGTQIAGIVSKIYVQIGSHVKAGDPLFTIDDRAQRALVAVKTAAVQVAEAQLGRAKYELGLGEGLTEKRVLSLEDRETRRYNAQSAEAQLAQSTAELDSAKTDLDRLTVRAPVDGQVMQLKVPWRIRPGRRVISAANFARWCRAHARAGERRRKRRLARAGKCGSDRIPTRQQSDQSAAAVRSFRTVRRAEDVIDRRHHGACGHQSFADRLQF